MKFSVEKFMQNLDSDPVLTQNPLYRNNNYLIDHVLNPLYWAQTIFLGEVDYDAFELVDIDDMLDSLTDREIFDNAEACLHALDRLANADAIPSQRRIFC